MSSAGGASSLGGQSQIPTIRPFQLDPQGFGALMNGVNLFRGEVSLPISLASLPGRGGLKAEATILCSTNVGKQTETWNLTAPTGPVGLGWSLGYEFIALDSKTTAAGTEDVYYLVAGGATNRLYPTAVSAGSVTFELEQYQFWKITYFPAEERWLIVKEDGQRWTYGGAVDDARSSLQLGVKWRGPDGNWTDGTSQTIDQANYVTAWNLAEVATLWGDVLRFEYDNDLLRVGGEGGLQYTRSSRIARVVDPTGQSIELHYEPKEHNASVREYQLPHVDLTSPRFVAWQDHIETNYLSFLEVRGHDSGDGQPLLQRIDLEYDLVNCSSLPADPDLFKRYLTGVSIRTADGLPLPKMTFAYYNRDEDRDNGIANGALRAVTYPQGGTVRYEYEATTLTGTSYDQALVPRGIPRVFFGPDYVVVTHIDNGLRGLTAEIHSWNGQWVSAQRSYNFGIEVDLETLRVSAADQFFALSFHTKEAGPRLFLALFRRNTARFGDWQLDDFTELPIGPGGDQGLVATGRDFVVAITSGGAVLAKIWDPLTRTWLDRRNSIVVPPNARYALAALDRYVVLAAWNAGSKSVLLSLDYVDVVTRDFRSASLQNDRINDVDWRDETPDSFFSPAASFVSMTYPIPSSGDFQYGVTVLQWDDQFRGSFTFQQQFTVAKPTELPYLQTSANGSMIGNVTNLFRFDGTDWTLGSLGSGPPSTGARFIFGNDAGIVMDGNDTAVQLYNAFNRAWTTASVGSFPPAGAPAPTIAANYFTVGRSVFFREPDGTVTPVADLDPNMNPDSLSNRAPFFLAYEDQGGNTHVIPLRNGTLRTDLATTLPNEKIVANVEGPGTTLVGGSVLVTYTGASLDSASSLTLRQYVNESLDGPIVMRPVTSLVIDDGYPNIWGPSGREMRVSYRYDCQNVTVAPGEATIAEFAAATAIYGAERIEAGGCYPPPAQTLQGSSEFRFHNNRSPLQNGFVLTEAAGGVAEMEDYTLLVGLIFDRTDRDAEGVAVARQVSKYEVRRRRELLDGSATVPLFGSYTKVLRVEDTFYESIVAATAAGHPLSRGALDHTLHVHYARHGIDASRGVLVERVPGRVWTLFPDPESHVFYPVVLRDGVVTASVAVIRRSDNAFSPATGLTTMQSLATTDSVGKRVTLKTLQYYAWQVPEYAGMRDLHLLTQPVVTLKITDPANDAADALAGTPTEISLTTYRQWFPGRWAAARTFAASTAAVYEPSAVPPVRFTEWNNGSLPPDAEWRFTSEVLRRLATGPVVEALDASLRPTATLFDTTASFKYATSTNASSSELAYAGFESYETLTDWKLASGQPLSSSLVRGDAHTGVQSLGLSGGAAVEITRTLADPSRPWLLSCWIKSAAPLGTSAQWQILAGGTEVARFPIDGTSGTWEYRGFPVSLSGAGPLQIVIRATNAGATQLLLDDVFFAPLAGAAEANVYHETFLDLAAAVGFNSATTRSLLDSRRRPATDVGAAGSVTNAVMPYATQLFHEVPDGDPFVYPQIDPDAVVALTPTEPSPFANFHQGDAWKNEWTFNGAAWRVVDGTLVHTGSSADAIAWNPTNGWSDYGARASVVLPVDAYGQPVLPRRPLGIRLGSRFEAKWESAGQWTIALDGTAVSVTTGTSAFQNDWLVAAPADPVSNVTSLVFYADGKLLFTRNLDAPLSGAFSIFAQDADIGFHGIAAMRAPRINLTFTDGSGKQRQRHAWSGAGDYVTGTFYDPVGRPAIPLKTILASENPFAYVPDLVTSFDSLTGVMTGRVADFYPDDEGYPYARTDYYRSPLAMTSAQSLPGRELAITGDNPHVRRFIYGTNAPPFWDAQWPSGEYFVQRTIDPDGGNTFTLRTKTDQVVAVKSGPMADGAYQTAVTEYDDAGRAVRQYLPNHFEASAPPDSFVVEMDYNFLGEMTAVRNPDAGTTRQIGDRNGQKRFSLTNDGGLTGTILYAKYDPLGRTLEQGFFEGTWNQAFLAGKALDDPAWPDDAQPHTWTLRNEYDGNGSDPAEIGRLLRATTRGDGDVIQTLTYNIAGALTRIEQTASSFDATPRALGYTYNVAGDNVGLTYPEGSPVPEVRQSYDRVGNPFLLGTPQSPSEFGSYEYNAAGSLQRATLDPQSARPLVRTLDYNSPGWPLEIRTTVDGATLLAESLTYTSGGYNGAAFYSGQAASVTFDGSATTEYSYRNDYDRLRQLTVAENTTDPNASLGVPAPLTYDANGNFDQYVEGAETRQYDYENGTDRVERVTAGGTAIDGYTYTEQGNVQSAQRLKLENLTYQPATGLPSSIRTPDGRTLAFSYDQNGQRVVKTLRGDGEVAAKLYVRGTSLMPLAETSRGTSNRDSQYIYGPDGLQGLLTGGRRYTVVRDHLGSVRAVVDEQRNLVASFEYLPFGTLIRRGGSTPDLFYHRFTGQELDPETGLYAFKARMYDPWLGRFYAVDPAGAGFSPYPYADNDPLNLVDPTGEEPLTVFLILLAIGIVVGAVAGLVTYAATYQGDFDGLKFVLYGVVGAIAGGLGAAGGFVAGQLTVAALAAAGVATSTTIGSGIVVGAVTAGVEGAISGGLNQIGQNAIEKRAWNEGLGLAIGMGAGIGAVTGATLGGVTGALNRRVAMRLAQADVGAHATSNGNLYNNTWLNVANDQGNNFVGAVQNTGANEVLSLAGHGSTVTRNITDDLGNTVISSAQIVNAAPVGGFKGYGVNLMAVCHAGRNGIARDIASGFKVPVRAANSATHTYGAGGSLAGKTMAIPGQWEGLLARTGRFETIYPSRLKTGWVGIFGY